MRGSRFVPLLPAVLFSGAIISPITAQTVPMTRLAQPVVSWTTPFSRIMGLRELADGRLLVADQVEAKVLLMGAAGGEGRILGRQGSGPGEYTRPNALYAVAGDTTLLLDLGGRRLLTIAPDGRLLDRVARLELVQGGFRPPRGLDGAGRAYFDLEGIWTSGLGDAAERGVAHVLRTTPGSGRVDTVAEFRTMPMLPPSGTGMRPLPPYRPRDTWGVDPAGRVAVVRHDPYRVEWHLPDQRDPVVGPAVSYRPVRIGRAEQQAYVDRLSGEGATINRGGQVQALRPPRVNVGDLEWPAVLPPFEGPALISSTGQVWVRRHRPASEPRALYDLFDAAGRLVRQVELPEGRRLVALGREAAYAVRVDDDGLQWLERYAVR